MEQSANIWSLTVVKLGGADLTLGEALVFVVAIVAAIVLLRRLSEGEKRSAEAERAEADRTLETKLAEMAQAHATSQAALDARIAALLEASATSQDTLRKSVDERLESVAKRLGDGLSENHKRTSDSLTKLYERLALIEKAEKNIETLTGEVTGLQALLANKQSRGAFGEIQMQDIVRNYMPPDSFEFQCSLSNNARVDCLIKLPSPPGSVAVDAKFPLESWRAYSEADDAGAKDAASRQFKADVLKHVKDIAAKYLIPGETADSALMFLPSEAVYATLHADFPDVVERAFKARVMIVSPTTFMATLHTMRAVMRDARLREQAHVIQKEVSLLADDVGRLDDRVAKLQKHFDQANEDVRQIRISTEKVVRRAERIEEAPVEESAAEALPAPDPKRIAAE